MRHDITKAQLMEENKNLIEQNAKYATVNARNIELALTNENLRGMLDTRREEVEKLRCELFALDAVAKDLNKQIERIDKLLGLKR